MRICNSLIIVKLSTPKLISASYLSFKSFYPYPSCIDYILFWLYNTSIDTVWKSTGSCNSSSIVTQMTVPFLPMNTEFSATRNQVIIEYTMYITLLSLSHSPSIIIILSSIRNQVNIEYTSLSLYTPWLYIINCNFMISFIFLEQNILLLFHILLWIRFNNLKY